MKKLFVHTYGCPMASLLHTLGGFDAELERVCGEIEGLVHHLFLGVDL